MWDSFQIQTKSKPQPHSTTRRPTLFSPFFQIRNSHPRALQLQDHQFSQSGLLIHRAGKRELTHLLPSMALLGPSCLIKVKRNCRNVQHFLPQTTKILKPQRFTFYFSLTHKFKLEKLKAVWAFELHLTSVHEYSPCLLQTDGYRILGAWDCRVWNNGSKESLWMGDGSPDWVWHKLLDSEPSWHIPTIGRGMRPIPEWSYLKSKTFVKTWKLFCDWWGSLGSLISSSYDR